jgi:hypothetical protein
MSTVADTRVVDWLGIEKETGHVNLIVVDDLDWSDEQKHLLLLQEKLNAYLAFSESGEVFERLLEETGCRVPTTTPIKVTIIAKFDLTALSRAFLTHVSEVFKGAGFSLVHKVVKAPS